MKKIFTLIAAMIGLTLVSNAQTDTLLYQNFNDSVLVSSFPTINNGNDTTWIDLDDDNSADANGRPVNWYYSATAFAGDDTTGCVLSSSWLSPAGAAKNYLMSPPVTITDATAVLSWKSAPYQTPSYLDGYKVLISTTDNIESSFTDTIFVAAEYLAGSATTAGNDYSLYTFSPGYVHGLDGTYIVVDATNSGQNSGILEPFQHSLAAYVGQTIYVAFLHDSFDDNLMAIDDVLVTQASALGINEHPKQGGISIYPNPVAENLGLEYNLSTNSNVIVRIYDAKGAIVKEVNKGAQHQGLQKMNIGVADLSSGIYSVNFIADGKSIQSKVLINHK